MLPALLMSGVARRIVSPACRPRSSKKPSGPGAPTICRRGVPVTPAATLSSTCSAWSARPNGAASMPAAALLSPKVAPAPTVVAARPAKPGSPPSRCAPIIHDTARPTASATLVMAGMSSRMAAAAAGRSVRNCAALGARCTSTSQYAWSRSCSIWGRCSAARIASMPVRRWCCNPLAAASGATCWSAGSGLATTPVGAGSRP